MRNLSGNGRNAASNRRRARGRRSLRVERLEPRALLALIPLPTAGEESDWTAVHLPQCGCPICTGIGLEQIEAVSYPSSPAESSPLTSLPQLRSNPEATAKLFLDFDGHFEASWSFYQNVSTPAFDLDGDRATFSTVEHSAIQEIWARVAEDYAPFNIDVTTIDPGTQQDKVAAIIAIGGSHADWYGASAGGTAFIGGFFNAAPNVGYVFEDSLGGSAKFVSEATAHEAGHLFGLQHQSIWSGDTLLNQYNHGNGAWAPIMGVGYSATRTTWFNGPTPTGPSILQDDLAVLANSNNAFGFMLDDFADSIATASTLPVSGNSVDFSGLIGRNNDADFWSFSTTGASVSFQLGVAPYGPNLDAILEIQNAAGEVLVTAAPTNSPAASISTSLSSGTYYLSARSGGDYGNLGRYTITGTLSADDAIEPTANIVDVSPDPRNSSVGDVIISFSEAVTGVDIGDFTLTRGGTLVSLSGLSFSGSLASYTINLSSVTTQAGNYILTLTASGSGITDASGNALSVDSTDSWTTDITAPTANIVDVSPDPRNSGVGDVTITFNELVTGVDIGDFTLTRGGNPVSLTGLAMSGSMATYTLNISSVTSIAGDYSLTLTASGSGITDTAGNALSADATDGWITDTTAPTANIVDVTPDPRNNSVGNVFITFSEPVSGVDIGDFTLTRGGAPVSLSGLSVSGSLASYTLNLSSVTALSGDYVLTLVSAGSGITDATGNVFGGDAIDSWITDATPPTANIVDVMPDPRNNSIGNVSITFSEPVTGLDIGDFALTRNGSLVSLVGLSAIGSLASYTLNLSSVTSLPGDYVLTVVAVGSGVTDAAGNALSTSASDSWTTDAAAPTANIVDVSPDPRNGDVSEVTITFNEPVTGLDIGDFALTRSGNPVSLSGLSVSGSLASYTLNLSSVTALAGDYVLTLVASGSGITDPAGNFLAANATDGWNTDTTVPTANIVDVSPDPRSGSVGGVTITFVEPVTGLDIDDFILTRSGSPVSLSGLSISGSLATYTLNLSTVTDLAGDYLLTLRAFGSGIADTANNALVADATDSWTIDTTAPAANIVAVTPDPRNSSVGDVTITFNEPVAGLDIGDFTLTRGGSPVSLSGLSVSGSLASYTLNLSSVTALSGDFVLTLVASGSGITDVAGNALAANVTDGWTTDTTVPAAEIADVTPDPRNGSAGDVTITFSKPVTGLDIGDFTLTRDGNPVSLSGLSVSGSLASYSLNLATVTALAGDYLLTLVAAGSGITDTAGNTLPDNATDSWTTDTTSPTANIVAVTPDPRNTSVGPVSILFSEQIGGIDINDFALTRDGNPVSLAGASISGSLASYTLNLSSVTALAGTYLLTLASSTAGITDTAGNGISGDASDSWTTETSVPTVNFGEVTPDPRNSSLGDFTVTFSEPVVGLDISDFTLTRNSSAVSLNGLNVSGSLDRYTLNLSSVTALAGNYRLLLTAPGSGIADAFGNALQAGAEETWLTDTTPPTASIAEIAPDPRNGPVGDIAIALSEPVTGLDLGDFVLTRDGTPVLPAGWTLIGSGADYSLHLAATTRLAGTYVLTLAAAGSEVADASGNTVQADVQDSWLMDDAPPLASIIDVAPDPRNSSVGDVTINFSEPVVGLDIGDFALTRDGSPLLLGSLNLSGSGANYTLNLAALTAIAGNYVLTLAAAGSGIVDAAGNSLTNDSSDAWTTDITVPVVQLSEVTPDPRNSSVGDVAITFSEPVSGLDLSDFILTRGGSPISLDGLTLGGSGTAYTLNLSSLTTVSGSYVFGLVAAGSGISDPAGNLLAAGAFDTWLTDVIGPLANISDVTPDPRNSAVGEVMIAFSEPVMGVDASDFTLSHDGNLLLLDGLSVSGNGTTYSLDLGSLTAVAGDYVLRLVAAASGIRDSAANLLAQNAEDSWHLDTSVPTADILDVSPDPRNSSVTSVVIAFSEPVTGLDIGDFSLTRGHVSIALPPTALLGSGSIYVVNLGSLTALPGLYSLILAASNSGIRDAAGNGLQVDASDNWVTKTSTPTATMVGQIPNPRTSTVGIVTISFSEPVIGVDIGDFTLTQDGIPVSLTGLTLNGSGATYTLDLSTMTGLGGAYDLVLTAHGSGIVDSVGNALMGNASANWRTNPWHNYSVPLDVDAEQGVSAVDALIVVNELNMFRVSLPGTGFLLPPSAGVSHQYMDVNDDGFVSFLDALLIFNALNASAASAPAQGPPAPPSESAAAMNAALPPPQDQAVAKADASPLAAPSNPVDPHTPVHRFGRLRPAIRSDLEHRWASPTNDTVSDDLLNLLAADIHEDSRRSVSSRAGRNRTLP